MAFRIQSGRCYKIRMLKSNGLGAFVHHTNKIFYRTTNFDSADREKLAAMMREILGRGAKDIAGRD